MKGNRLRELRVDRGLSIERATYLAWDELPNHMRPSSATIRREEIATEDAIDPVIAGALCKAYGAELRAELPQVQARLDALMAKATGWRTRRAGSGGPFLGRAA